MPFADDGYIRKFILAAVTAASTNLQPRYSDALISFRYRARRRVLRTLENGRLEIVACVDVSRSARDRDSSRSSRHRRPQISICRRAGPFDSCFNTLWPRALSRAVFTPVSRTRDYRSEYLSNPLAPSRHPVCHQPCFYALFQSSR